MTNLKLINIVWLTALTIASIAYLSLLARYIPDKHALIVNFMLVPLLFGFAGYFLINANLAIKIIFLAAIPIAHIIYFGKDSTKPGLENMVAVGEYVFICVGVVVSHLARKYLL